MLKVGVIFGYSNFFSYICITNKKHKTMIEIFGRRLTIVEGDNSNNCQKCALKDFCYPYKYPMPCKNANGEVNRHFEYYRENG